MRFISPLTNRYTQLIEKTDYLLRALDCLFQREVVTMEEYNVGRGLFKRRVMRFYYACRRFDDGPRSRMNENEVATERDGAAFEDDGAAQAVSSPRAVAKVAIAPTPGRHPKGVVRRGNGSPNASDRAPVTTVAKASEGGIAPGALVIQTS